MGSDQLQGDLQVRNFDNYNWDMNVNGSLDLEVISEVYPVEGMQYSGMLKADIHTKGAYADVEAERYDRLPTSGTMQLSNFEYRSEDLPQALSISTTDLVFNPDRLEIKEMAGTIGQSDFSVQGFVQNYIDYTFSEDAVLKGEMNLNSNMINVNEMMSDEAESVEDTTQMEVVEIPKNINFEFNSSIGKIIYDNLTLNNAKGKLTVREGVLDMRNLSFDLLGGSIVMNGAYDTQNPAQPAFDFELDISALSIPAAFTSFSTVQAFAPMAQQMEGEFSSDFKISGLLSQNMSPVLNTLDGSGLIKIAEAQLKNSKLVAGISDLTKLSGGGAGGTALSLKDVILQARIEDGRAYVQPFDVQLGKHAANLAGSIGIDGSLNYKVATTIKAGELGQQINSLIAKATGEKADNSSSEINLNFGVGGTYKNPKIELLGSSGDGASVKEEMQEEVKEQLEEKAQQEAQEQIDQVIKDKQPEIDSLKKQLEDKVGKETADEIEKAAEDVGDALKGLFNKKK
jgi:hypothetical protein